MGGILWEALFCCITSVDSISHRPALEPPKNEYPKKKGALLVLVETTRPQMHGSGSACLNRHNSGARRIFVGVERHPQGRKFEIRTELEHGGFPLIGPLNRKNGGGTLRTRHGHMGLELYFLFDPQVTT